MLHLSSPSARLPTTETIINYKQKNMRILLVDDHELFREGVALLLRRLSSDLDITQAGSCEEALALPDDSGFDLLLLDIGLPGMSGLEGIALFKQKFLGLPIVALSSSEDYVLVRRTIDAGAMGFIPKTSSADVMIGALQLVLSKGIYLPPSVFLGQSAPTDKTICREFGARPVDLGLTDRQTDVLYLVLQGKSVKLICREIGLAESTVKSHISAVLRALNVTTRTQAIVAASRIGLRFEQTREAVLTTP